MSYLKNPYLSFDSENLLIRKNYKVIQSSSKKDLFPNYQPTIQKSSNQKPFKNHQPPTSLTSIANVSSCPKLKNPFDREILTQRSLNIKGPYMNARQQPYFHYQRQNKKQPPFPSYNRPQFNRSVSLTAKGVVVSSKQHQLLQKSIKIPYRPHFISPTSPKNSWNTQRWKRESELKQRMRLEEFGPQCLRYDGKLPHVVNGDLNIQYYSTSNSSMNNHMIQSNNTIKPINTSQQRTTSIYQQTKAMGYAIYSCSSKQHNERNIISSKDKNNDNDDDYAQMMGQSFDENNGGFQSKYGDNNMEGGESRGGPLDLRAFDSGYYVKKEESFQYIVKQNISRESSKPSQQFPKINQPYPQQLSYHGKPFYRIKLIEDSNS